MPGNFLVKSCIFMGRNYDSFLVKYAVEILKDWDDCQGFNPRDAKYLQRIFRSPKQVFYWEIRKLTLF